MIRLASIFALLVMCGCTFEPKICGLRPIYPRASVTVPKVELNKVLVDSLQPTLRWQAFSPSASEGQIPPETVHYDLRIMDTDQNEVYAVAELPDASHRLQTPLQANTVYLWTIRARFKVNGQTRVTRWTCSQFPWSGADPCKVPDIPMENYLRFKTPA